MKSCLIRPAVDIAGQLQNAVSFADCRAKLTHEQRRRQVLQRGVDRVNQQLHHDRLMRTGQDQTRARFRHQIVGRFGRASDRRMLAPCRRLQVSQERNRDPASLVAAAIFPASAWVNAGIWLAGQRSR